MVGEGRRIAHRYPSQQTGWRPRFRAMTHSSTPTSERLLAGDHLQVSKEEVVVRHMGKDATVPYEFKNPVDIIKRT